MKLLTYLSVRRSNVYLSNVFTCARVCEYICEFVHVYVYIKGM